MLAAVGCVGRGLQTSGARDASEGGEPGAVAVTEAFVAACCRVHELGVVVDVVESDDVSEFVEEDGFGGGLVVADFVVVQVGDPGHVVGVLVVVGDHDGAAEPCGSCEFVDDVWVGPSDEDGRPTVAVPVRLVGFAVGGCSFGGVALEVEDESGGGFELGEGVVEDVFGPVGGVLPGEDDVDGAARVVADGLPVGSFGGRCPGGVVVGDNDVSDAVAVGSGWWRTAARCGGPYELVVWVCGVVVEAFELADEQYGGATEGDEEYEEPQVRASSGLSGGVVAGVLEPGGFGGVAFGAVRAISVCWVEVPHTR